MKVAVWSVFALLALVWTGGAAMLALLAHAAAAGLAGSGGLQLPDAGAWPMPQWLSGWIDPALWQSLWQSATAAWAALASWMPALSTALSWLEPAIWVGWGLGLVVLLAVAGLAAWVAGRFKSSPRRALAGGTAA